MDFIVTGYDTLGTPFPVIIHDMREVVDEALGNDVYTKKVRIFATIPCGAEIVRLTFPDGSTFVVMSRQLSVLPGTCRAVLEGQFEEVV